MRKHDPTENEVACFATDRRLLVELCAGGIDDVLLAAELQVDRIELNCGVSIGGLTPSMGLFHEARSCFSGPIVVMVRPREGGFCYSPAEYRQMLCDAQSLIDLGADGVAAGFLTLAGKIDEQRCSDFRQKFPAASLVFHRAFDLQQDPDSGMQQLMQLGWNRILTSGTQPTALQGASVLKRLHAAAADRIEILPAGGIRGDHVVTLCRETGIRQVHTAASTWADDSSTLQNQSLNFNRSDRSTVSNGACLKASRKLLVDLLNAARSQNSSGGWNDSSLVPDSRGSQQQGT